MPFLGKDWRSSGEHWIRTEHGWERTKVLECILDNLNMGLKKENRNFSKKQKKFISESSNRRINSECDDEDDSTGEHDDSTSKLNRATCEMPGMNNQNDLAELMEDDSSIKDDNNENDDLSSSDDDYLSDDDDDENIDEPNDALNENRINSTNRIRNESGLFIDKKFKKEYHNFKKLCISTNSLASSSYKTRQPHIIYFGAESASNRGNNGPKASVSEVLNALDMPGAVRDIKRFNYVCKLVQLIINEKLNQLSGNAQRTLFMIVKQILIQVIKTQENTNIMRKLLFDFKKKIQDSYYYYFYYIGSQKLCERHLATISKWQEMLENPNHKKVKRLTNNSLSTTTTTTTTKSSNAENSNSASSNENKENHHKTVSFDNIPVDCKLEIMRRLNTGLDLVNLSKCNRNLNDIITQELTIWKNLCQFHFQQTSINLFLNKQLKSKLNQKTYDNESTDNQINHESKDSHLETITNEIKSEITPHHNSNENISELDWKMIYFKLKRRYGHREVYVDMIHKCFYCKCLFWKEIGHPCCIAASLTDQVELEVRTEPITPKKLIDLLLK